MASVNANSVFSHGVVDLVHDRPAAHRCTDSTANIPDLSTQLHDHTRHISPQHTAAAYTYRAASMPSVFSTSMMWFDVVFVPRTPGPTWNNHLWIASYIHWKRRFFHKFLLKRERRHTQLRKSNQGRTTNCHDGAQVVAVHEELVGVAILLLGDDAPTACNAGP